MANRTDYERIGDIAVAALKWEANFSPKPGLVDAIDNGAHEDMNVHLFEKSAEALRPYFYALGEAANGAQIGLELRQKIGALGREAEKRMYDATNGVNTHKGAIWALGLIVTSWWLTPDADQYNLLNQAGLLAQLSDANVENSGTTYGQMAAKKYGVGGAKAEAQSGFVHLQNVLKQPSQTQDDWLRILLKLYASIDDTNVIHRSNLETLRQMQVYAQQVVDDVQPVLENSTFQKLEQFMLVKHISPGGSADLFAARRFLVTANL
jgi:triphosphoribosyl-dephospho-CoA synthase